MEGLDTCHVSQIVKCRTPIIRFHTEMLLFNLELDCYPKISKEMLFRPARGDVFFGFY